MDFKTTAWEFDDVEEKTKEFVLPDPGEQYLKIIGAEYDRDKHKYIIDFETVNDGIEFRLFYNVDRINNRTGDYDPNVSVRNCLVGLKKAIFNTKKGLPYPDDIVGAVVLGEVQIREYDGTDAEGNPVKKKAVSIWRYGPVPEDIVLSYGEIEQYYEEMAEDGEDDGAE